MLELSTGSSVLQPYEMTLDKVLSHAGKWHGMAQVVTGGGCAGAIARVGYAELNRRARCLSGGLTGFGLAHGDRIATLAWNSQSHMECWYAAFGIGVAVHTLNPRLGTDQLCAMIDQAGDRLIAVSPDLLSVAVTLAERCQSVERVIVLEEPDAEAPAIDTQVPVHSIGALIDGSAEAVWGNFSEQTEAALCFTSGTTGAPKGVTYTHRCNYLVTLALLQRDVMGIGAGDAILVAVPMFHANAWALPFAGPASGAKLVFSGRHNDGASLARLIRDEGVTLAVGVPTVWLGLLDHLDRTGEGLPSLERVLLGGSGVSQAMIDRLRARLGVTVQTSWGMTELSPLGTVTAAHEPSTASIAGRPSLGVDLRLCDENGRELEEQRGAEGHLQVRGSSTIDRYLGHDTSVVDEAGWFATGDLATIDASGNLSITGRAKDLIKSGGEWINPAEIEAVVGAMPGVSLVAVIGRADPKWTERPVLVVEGDHVPSDAQIRSALERELPRWWMPDTIERVDRMPIAMTGKIDKAALRARFGAAT